MASSSYSSPELDEPFSKRRRTTSNAPESEEAEPTSFATSPLLTIYIGPEQHKFMIHKDLLIKKSPYFEKCLKPTFAEGQFLEIKLQEDDVASFEIFVTWIYKGVVEDIDIRNWASKKQTAIEVWVLGDKWCMHEFQNKILETFQKFHRNWASSPDDLLYVSRLELHDSKLGNYLFDQLAYHLSTFGRISFVTHILG